MMDSIELRTLKDDLAAQAKRYLHELHGVQNRVYTLRWPWVLVFVLPREQEVRGLILPDSVDQTKRTMKVTLEGIVLQLWEDETKPPGELKVGDHVLFPHIAGVPFDENYSASNMFRSLKEEQLETVHGLDDSIFATLDNVANTQGMLEEIAGVIPARRILDLYWVMPKNVKSRTLSAFGDRTSEETTDPHRTFGSKVIEVNK